MSSQHHIILNQDLFQCSTPPQNKAQPQQNFGPWSQAEQTKYTFCFTQANFKQQQGNNSRKNSEANLNNNNNNTNTDSAEKRTTGFIRKKLSLNSKPISSEDLKLNFMAAPTHKSKKFVPHETPRTNVQDYFHKRLIRKPPPKITNTPVLKQILMVPEVQNPAEDREDKSAQPQASLHNFHRSGNSMNRFRSLPAVHNVKRELQISRKVYIMMNRSKMAESPKPQRKTWEEQKQPPLTERIFNRGRKLIIQRTTKMLNAERLQKVQSLEKSRATFQELKNKLALRQTQFPVNNQYSSVQRPNLKSLKRILNTEDEQPGTLLSNQLIRKRMQSK